MRYLVLGSLLASILLSLLGCQQTTNHNSEGEMEDFVEPESSDRVKYTNPLREYMYYRTQAVINNDINILWDKYPDLKDNIDLELGVNAENEELKTLNADFDMLDANYNIEGFGRIKVKTINDNEVIVLLHGGIGYLRSDFEESGGELLIKVFLEYKDNDWKVVKTDEYTLPEYKEWMKEKSS
ncbi:hypothetical protein [Ureibacillus aquaedulcis]|uniref:Lipoprotein n=1 Tax=Ureibacillus aquaedulcis TaxID=3058421 RepID=A0ABT8GM45_9BACL|nr:hypothetical protein [Ureibacillus sp. BA0131]MDN4492500.1 hypothetical protein [Ureibacillus sp. BA0131]